MNVYNHQKRSPGRIKIIISCVHRWRFRFYSDMSSYNGATYKKALFGSYLPQFCKYDVPNEDFDQIYLKTDSKTQNVEKLSLDLIFYNNFW